MNEREWLTTKAKDLLSICPIQVSERKLRLFACQCARHVLQFGDYADFRQALRVAEEMAERAVSAELVQQASHRTESLSRLLSITDAYIASAVCAALHQDPHHAASRAQHFLSEFETDTGYPWASVEWFRCIVGNPFRQVDFAQWRIDTAVSLSRQMYDSRDFGAMPILADALQDAGCNNADVLSHCRGDGPHVRGCWVIDGVLGLE